jgi:hypothetical protein
MPTKTGHYSKDMKINRVPGDDHAEKPGKELFKKIEREGDRNGGASARISSRDDD